MHAEYSELMSAVLDDEATPMDAARLQDHLTACAACAGRWQEWQALHRRLARAPMIAAPSGLSAEVMARIVASRQHRDRTRWFGSGLIVAWGLLLCVGWVCVALACWWGLRHPLEVSVVLSSGALLLSNLSRLLRNLGVLAGAANGAALLFGVVLLVGLVGALALLWVWVVAHSRDWRRPAVGETA